VVCPDGKITEGRYWQLNPEQGQPYSSDEAVIDRFREIFSDAVRLRLRSDVPVASMLSGGLDSSSVTCMAAQLSGRPITTFSARYDETDFDEGPFIESTVQHVGADGRLIYPKPGDLIETLDEMLSFHDEPVCTVTWFAHWMVMKEVAKMEFPVLLNGHVGDELFAGYWDHYQYNFADLEHDEPDRFKYEFGAWLTNHERDPKEYERLKEKLSALESGRIHPSDPLTQYSRVATAQLAEYSAPPDRPNPFGDKGYLTSRLHQELVYETVPATLRPEDRNSMAFSIETRSPFLDYRLAEFAFSLPNRYKIRNGLGKWIIREGMKGILPESVRNRKDKQGFNAPTRHWFRDENRDSVRSILESKSLAARGLLNQAEVLKCFDDHVAGRADHYQSIWQWLNLELWMRRVFDSPEQQI
jgi:asparagine synthase (glutamine-hydrolysing)